MKIYFIRHGATRGNAEGRYVGITDESILPKAATELGLKAAPHVKAVYISPMKRCRETADILYPDTRHTVIEEFKECSFGSFEYLSYNELKDNRVYIELIKSGGRTGFPGGESRCEFQKRCVSGFEKMPRDTEDIAVIAHGGTIMALLDEYSYPHRDYYFWQCENGGGFSARLTQGQGKLRLEDIEEIKL